MPASLSVVSNDLLDRMQYRADDLADTTIDHILGPWTIPFEFTTAGAPAGATTSPATLAAVAAPWQPQWQKLAAVTDVFPQWTDNRAISDWRAPAAGNEPNITPGIAAPLEAYLQAGRILPAWADRAKIARAEELFMDYGALSVTMLFCSSLPECYVIPDLAAVLHVTGQLEKHTEYRVRMTGAMIFPVMMKGGLTDPDGGGIAQILKVRLIHATIRNLILRGSPADALRALGAHQNTEGAGVVPPLPGLRAADNMHQALFAHGWKTGEEGLPCNQEELAYTLLTFSYVFLRSMRKLGLALTGADEEAYLHAWNVAGHVLGIDRALMPATMAEAGTLFADMQARGRAATPPNPALNPDPRPALGNALMDAMSSVIPLVVLKPFPLLMTRHLCGRASAQDLGLNGPVSWLSRLLFTLFMLVVRAIDGVVRLVFPAFSIARFLTRLLGYHLMSKLLMDQTRPLKLPQHVRDRVEIMMAHWSDDPKAPAWMNSLEDRMTVKGSWTSPVQK
ncbi:MAG: oxygenase MpaB family protein [Betaproteobacteria bacterium]